MNATLPTARLGRTGLEVTRLGFGTALFGPTSPTMSGRQVERLMNAVLDSGINFIDTSHDYIDSESQIGKFLSSRYSEFYLATKCGCTDTWPDRNNSEHVWTRDNMFLGLETSLRRLGRDSVDVMQLHNPTEEDCEIDVVVDALEEMRRQGKVKWTGVSTILPDLPAFLDSGAFDVCQIPYSALEREHEDLITRAGEAGMGTIIRGGIAQGEPGAGRESNETWEKFETAGLDPLRENGESRSAFVLRFTLTHPHVHTIIVGTRNLDHLRENVEAVQRGPLPAETYQEAKRRLDAIGESPAALE